MPNILLYIIIVIVKTFELSMATVRIKLITKGQKLAGSIIGFFEIIIWLIVVSIVLQDIASDPFKIIAYSLGFALGNYLGSILEEKIGLGSARMDVIVREAIGIELAQKLREKNYAVTIVDGMGRNFPRKILIVIAKRKEMRDIHQFIMDETEEAFITTTDITPIVGGYRVRK